MGHELFRRGQRSWRRGHALEGRGPSGRRGRRAAAGGAGEEHKARDRFNYRLESHSGTGRVRGYAEKVLLADWEPIPIPDGVSDEEAAMCEPSAVAVHAVRLSQMRLGDSAVVLGAGLSVCCVCRRRGQRERAR